jgi:hypothetical protein
LLSLGLACWPYRAVVTAQATSALFVYNLLAALYFAYLGAAGGFSGYLLWPVCVLHGVIAILLARPAYDAVRRRPLGPAAFHHNRSFDGRLRESSSSHRA